MEQDDAHRPFLRVAEPRDFSGAEQLRKLLFPKQFPYEDNIGRPGTRNLVVTFRSSVIGFSSALTEGARPQGKQLWERIRPYIGFVGIHPSHQRNRIGSCLLSQTCQFVFKTTNFSELYLECEEPLTSFYRKNSFSTLSPEMVEMRFGKNPTNSVLCKITKDAVCG